MTLKLTDGLTPQWWTPEGYENDDNPVAFQLQPLTGPQMLELRQYFNTDAELIEPKGLMLACRQGLIGWRNVEAADGKPQVFYKSAIDKLSHDWIALIAVQVINLSVISPADEKN